MYINSCSLPKAAIGKYEYIEYIEYTEYTLATTLVLRVYRRTIVMVSARGSNGGVDVG